MKRLMRLLKTKEVLIALSMIILCLFIFLGLPLLSFSGERVFASLELRMGLVLGLLLVAIGIFFAQWVRVQKVNEKLLLEIQDNGRQEVAQASESEAKAVAEHFTQALQTLKNARLHRGKRLYQIPWYAVIGPPGSGKTSCILNSGLKFPLEETSVGKPIKGAGGTRNCDFWFSDEAVLVDTAGRYTTQDSFAEVDSSGWTSFLASLAQYRRKRPLNGLLVVMSLEELAKSTPAEQSQHAKSIRKRILELQNTFHMAIPVYVVLTKADMITGFREFFQDLDSQERKQIFGFTIDSWGKKHSQNGLLSEKSESNAQSLDRDFEDLWAKTLNLLYRKLPYRLQQVRNPLQRKLTLEYPKQLALLGTTIKSFCEEAFETSRYEESIQVRAITMTSSLQTGTPIDYLRDSVGLAYAHESQNAPLGYSGFENIVEQPLQRGYFLEHVFKNLIFAESALAGSSRLFIRTMKSMKTLGLAGVALSFTCILFGLVYGYYMNKQDLIETKKFLRSYTDTQTLGDFDAKDPVLVSRTLTDLLQIPNKAFGNEAQSPVLNIGLNQKEYVQEIINETYSRGNRAFVLPYLRRILEDTLVKTMDKRDSGKLYETLRVYLMVTSHPSQYQDLEVRRFFNEHWNTEFGSSRFREILAELRKHLSFAIERSNGRMNLGNRNDELVERVRYELNKKPLSERIFLYFLAKYQDSEVRPFYPQEALGLMANQVFYRKSGKSLNVGISGLFTLEGYLKVFKPKIDQVISNFDSNDWVFEPKLDDKNNAEDHALKAAELERERIKQLARIKKLTSQVTSRYIDLYILQWRRLIDDLSIRKFSSFSEALDQLHHLESKDSSLVRLFSAIKKHTQLTKAANPASEAISGLIQKKGPKTLKNNQDKLTAASLRALRRLPVYRIEEHFQDLAKLAPRDEGEPSFFIERLTNQAKSLKDLLGMIDIATDPGKASFDALAAYSSDPQHASKQLMMLAVRQPTPVNTYLQQIVQGSVSLLGKKTRSHIQSFWQGSPLSLCRNAIAGRYPLSDSNAEISLGEFADFFGHNGELDAFFEDFLSPFVEKSRKPWRFKVNLGMNPNTLSQFQLAEDLRSAFFASESRRLSVNFTVKPSYLSHAASQTKLSLGSKTINYRHGPQFSEAFAWPDTSGAGLARFELSPRKTGETFSLETAGPWALFRLIDQMTLSPLSSRQFDLLARQNGVEAQYTLEATSTSNPWNSLSKAKRFRCLEAL